VKREGLIGAEDSGIAKENGKKVKGNQRLEARGRKKNTIGSQSASIGKDTNSHKNTRRERGFSSKRSGR